MNTMREISRIVVGYLFYLSLMTIVLGILVLAGASAGLSLIVLGLASAAWFIFLEIVAQR